LNNIPGEKPSLPPRCYPNRDVCPRVKIGSILEVANFKMASSCAQLRPHVYLSIDLSNLNTPHNVFERYVQAYSLAQF
jgi:hypothetical protein